MTSTEAASSAAIEQDVEHERAELVDTLGRLRENLRPQNVVDEVMASAKITVSDLSDKVWRTARDNPIPAVFIGLGAAMLLGVGQTIRNRGQPEDHASAESGSVGHRDAGSWSDVPVRAGSRSDTTGGWVADRLDAVGRRATSAVDRISASTGDLRRQASRETVFSGLNTAHRGTSPSGDNVMNQYARSREHITHSFGKLLDEQPLVLAALGIAVGAAIGAAIPSSETEGQWMGGASDSVKQAARDMAQEQYAHLKETAGQALDQVKQSAAEHGLSTDNLSGLVQDVGNNVRSAAYAAGTHAAESAAATTDRTA